MTEQQGNNMPSIVFMVVLSIIAVAIVLLSRDDQTQANAGTTTQESSATTNPGNSDNLSSTSEGSQAAATPGPTASAPDTLPDRERLEQRVQKFEQLFYGRPLNRDNASFKQSLQPFVTPDSAEVVAGLNPFNDYFSQLQAEGTRVESNIDIVDVSLDATSTPDLPAAVVTVTVQVTEITAEGTAQDVDRTGVTRRWRYSNGEWHVELGEAGYNH